MKTASSPSIKGFIALRRRVVTIDTLAAQRLLKARGYPYPLTIELSRFSLENACLLEEGSATFLLSPFVVVNRLFGAIPLLWPAALTPLHVWRRRLAIILAHEARHLLQDSGAVPEVATWPKPLIGPEQVRAISRIYELFAAMILAIALLSRQSVSAFVFNWTLGVLLALGLTVLTLAIVFYCASPEEIDARRAERTDWKNWEDVIHVLPS